MKGKTTTSGKKVERKMNDVKFTDNSKEFIEEKNRAIMAALEAIGLTGEAYAKADCPVDTGRLRNSISHQAIDDTAYIGTNVEYAPEVEYNDRAHHTVGKAHFLRDAATTHTQEYKNIVLEQLKS